MFSISNKESREVTRSGESSQSYDAQRTKSHDENKDDLDEADSQTDLAGEVLIETRMEYLKTLVATILDELNSLHRLRADRESPLTLTREVRRFEAQLIRNALLISFGAQRRAARILGINPSTLNEKIKRLKIEIDDTRFGIQVDDTRFDSESARTPIEDFDNDWPVSLSAATSQFETRIIERALAETCGSQRKTAELLQIPISTLHFKIRKHEIDRSRFSTRRRPKLLLSHYDPLARQTKTES